jgi:transposase
MAAKWRNRFAADRVEGLLDEARPGRPRVISDDRIESLITATLQTTPPDAMRWSTRSLAAHLGLSQSMVSRVWRAFGLAPLKEDSRKLSKDPRFFDKVSDIVGLYLDPPERAVVLCTDEKAQVRALHRTAPVFPTLPGSPTRATQEYARHGTSGLNAARDPATGKVIGPLHSRHRFQEFLAFLKRSTPKCPNTLSATSFWTTPPPIRRRRSNAG